MVKMELSYMDLYEQIAKYYPIGFSDFDERYNDYAGFQKLQELCYKKLEPEEYDKWRLTIESIKNETAGIIHSTSDSIPFYPSYHGIFLLHKEQMGQATYLRSINVHLCVFAPYYTIYGLDQIILKTNEGKDLGFQPIVYISPTDIYTTYFRAIRNKIENEYAKYRFITFSLLRNKIPSLTVSSAHTAEGENASIFQALFQHEDVTKYYPKGEIGYE